MYNHKKQLVWTFLLGALGGTAGIKFAYDNSLLEASTQVLDTPPVAQLSPAAAPKPQQKENPFQDLVPLPQERVCELQELLAVSDQFKGRIDGLLGPQTRAAVRHAEQRLSQKVTGNPTVGLLGILRANAPSNRFDYFDIPQTNAKAPANGQVLASSNKPRVAPLEIRTQPNTGNYIVKLQQPGSTSSEMIFFVRGGGSANVEAPLGAYELKYANGSTFFSTKCLFGIYTTRSKAKTIFNFSSSGGRVSGYTVELILQRHGNLRTETINENEW